MGKNAQRLDDTLNILDRLAVTQLVGGSTVAPLMVGEQRRSLRSAGDRDLALGNCAVQYPNKISFHRTHCTAGIHTNRQ